MSRRFALKAFLSHYGDVIAGSWHDRPRAPRYQPGHEIDFLPAELELVERPSHPAARWSLLLCLGLGVGVTLLFTFGKVDIVASSAGHLVPAGRVKNVQSALQGVVAKLYVADGDRVRAGDLLMSLDQTQSANDLEKLDQGMQALRFALARESAALLGNDRVASNPASGRPPSDLSVASAQLLHAELSEQRAKLADFDGEIAKRRAEIDGVKASVSGLQASLPLADNEEALFREMAAQRLVTLPELGEKQRTAITQRAELGRESARLPELEAEIASFESRRSATVAEFSRIQGEAMAGNVDKLAQLQNDRAKAVLRHSLTDIRSPITGTVQQFNQHTLGAVVQTGQTLMDIVPDESFEVETLVDNKDIGFVAPGQAVNLMLDAYPFSRYGVLHGRVRSIANDSVQPNHHDAGFVVRITLLPDRFNVDGKPVVLTSGMSARIDIKTGRQSLGSYFIKPLIEAFSRSMHER